MIRIILILVTMTIIVNGESLFAVDICIDAGHGGSDPGKVTHIPAYDEKDINLDVSQALIDVIEDSMFYSFCQIRPYDFDILLTRRAEIVDSVRPLMFISIHHNTPVDTSDHTTQHTLALYSSFPFEEPELVESRNTTSALANKVGLGICEYFQYGMADDHPRDAYRSLTVLSRTKPPSCLSEGSFISVFAEAELFHDYDWLWAEYSDHSIQEALGIYKAMGSFYFNNGIGSITYFYAESGAINAECTTWVDWEPHVIPYEWLWTMGDYHTISAPSYFIADDSLFTFYRWRRVSTNDGQVIVDYSIGENTLYSQPPMVDFNGYHYLEALYSGGRFFISLWGPSQTMIEVEKNQPYTLIWLVAEGVNQTCSLYIDLSINGQLNWSDVAGPLAYNHMATKDAVGTYEWQVPNIESDNCYLRFCAYDIAGNKDTLISQRFRIGREFFCGDANNDTDVNLLDIMYLTEYLYQQGPEPVPYDAGDVNNDEDVNLLDILRLIDNLYDAPIGDPPLVCW